MSTTTKCIVAGAFASRAAADQAITELKRAGYRDDQIGLLAKNADGKMVSTNTTGEHIAEGAAIGAVAGAGVAAPCHWVCRSA